VFSVNDTAFNLLFVGGLFVGALLLPPDGHAPFAIVLIGAAYAVVATCYATVSRTTMRT
jgi:hypothetical protein